MPLIHTPNDRREYLVDAILKITDKYFDHHQDPDRFHDDLKQFIEAEGLVPEGDEHVCNKASKKPKARVETLQEHRHRHKKLQLAVAYYAKPELTLSLACKDWDECPWCKAIFTAGDAHIDVLQLQVSLPSEPLVKHTPDNGDEEAESL